MVLLSLSLVPPVDVIASGQAGTVACPLRSKRYAVIEKQRIVFATKVSDAVTRVESAALADHERQARRDIAKAVLAAEPVGDEIHSPMKRLFVANDGTPLVAISISASHQTVAAASHAWSIRTLPLLAHGGV